MWDNRRWRQLVRLAPCVRDRLMERLETLRVVTTSVVNSAAGMDDEELVKWAQALSDRASSAVRTAMN